MSKEGLKSAPLANRLAAQADAKEFSVQISNGTDNLKLLRCGQPPAPCGRPPCTCARPCQPCRRSGEEQSAPVAVKK